MDGFISDKKQQILIAASRLFRDKGYSATSMRDLARAVNLQASSLYNHIASKEEILQEICLANARRFHEGMEQAKALNNHSPSERLEFLMRLHIRMATQDITSVTSFNDEWRHLSEPHLSQFLDMRRQYESFIRHILREGIEQGVFRNMDESLLLYTLLSSIRWLYDWFEDGKRLSAQDLESQLIPLLMGGIRV